MTRTRFNWLIALCTFFSHLKAFMCDPIKVLHSPSCKHSYCIKNGSFGQK